MEDRHALDSQSHLLLGQQGTGPISGQGLGFRVLRILYYKQIKEPFGIMLVIK